MANGDLPTIPASVPSLEWTTYSFQPSVLTPEEWRACDMPSRFVALMSPYWDQRLAGQLLHACDCHVWKKLIAQTEAAIEPEVELGWWRQFVAENAQPEPLRTVPTPRFGAVDEHYQKMITLLYQVVDPRRPGQYHSPLASTLRYYTSQRGAIGRGSNGNDVFRPFGVEIFQGGLVSIEPHIACDLARCVYRSGDPDVRFPDTWHTAATIGLAQTIRTAAAFDRLPILADALEDAGCCVTDVLMHCREPVLHVRECWVLRGLLELEPR